MVCGRQTGSNIPAAAASGGSDSGAQLSLRCGPLMVSAEVRVEHIGMNPSVLIL